jgi:hypothetical protein
MNGNVSKKELITKNISNPITLKPCPVCQSKEELVVGNRLTPYVNNRAVVCNYCGHIGPLASTAGKAVECWNQN